MRQAARAWLRAMLTAQLPIIRGGNGSSVGIPPVWTGTARGTLKPLGKALGVAVPIKPVVKRPGMGPDVGAALGKFYFGKKFDRYYFRFSTALRHYEENEFTEAVGKKLIHRTPWEGLRVGQKAFQNYCDNVLPKRLPKVQQAIRYATRVIN